MLVSKCYVVRFRFRCKSQLRESGVTLDLCGAKRMDGLRHRYDWYNIVTMLACVWSDDAHAHADAELWAWALTRNHLVATLAIVPSGSAGLPQYDWVVPQALPKAWLDVWGSSTKSYIYLYKTSNPDLNNNFRVGVWFVWQRICTKYFNIC